MTISSLILDVLYPKHCLGCHIRSTFLCDACTTTIHFSQHFLCPTCGRPLSKKVPHLACAGTHLDKLQALGQYDGLLQTLIRQYKYDGYFALSETAIMLMTKHMPREYGTVDLIVPVPLHIKRLRERGFNQSELLAKGLARNLHIPSSSKLITRTRHTPAQATLKRKERLHNLDRAYVINQDVWNKILQTKPVSSVLLIDDVSTTGTTLKACAAVLKQVGVKKVYGYVLAHGA